MGKEADNDIVSADSLDLDEEIFGTDGDDIATIDDSKANPDEPDVIVKKDDTDAKDNNDTVVVDDKKDADKSADADPDKDKSSTGTELAGKSAEELVSIIEDMKSFTGRQASELGDLREQVRALSEKVTAPAAAPDQQAQAKPDPLDQIRELAKGFSDGNVPFEEVLVNAFRLGSEQASSTVSQEFEARQQAAEQARVRDGYLSANPDFLELHQKGELEKIKQTAPGIHNDVSAFEALKRQSAQSELETVKAELDRVKGELAAAQKAGVTPQEKVIANPGTTVRTTNKQRGTMSEGEAENMLVEKLRQHRAGA